jgi:hypothetical protein
MFASALIAFACLMECCPSHSQAWQLAGRPTIRIATVGGGTSAVLSGHCLVAFTPSKADAHTLAGARLHDQMTTIARF